jgi:hypothetical protein
MHPLGHQIASVDPVTCRLNTFDQRRWISIIPNTERMQWKPIEDMAVTMPRSSGLRDLQLPPRLHYSLQARGELYD